MVDITINKGKTFSKTIYWYGTDINGDPTEIDLTGCTARADIRESIDDAAAALTLTTENNRIALSNIASPYQFRDSDDNIVTLPIGTAKMVFTISATDTAAMTISSGVWEPEIVFPDATVLAPAGIGSVTIKDEVTR